MKNLGAAERVLRVLLGGALALWAAWMLLGGGSLLGVLLYIALAALGPAPRLAAADDCRARAPRRPAGGGDASVVRGARHQGNLFALPGPVR